MRVANIRLSPVSDWLKDGISFGLSWVLSDTLMMFLMNLNFDRRIHSAQYYGDARKLLLLSPDITHQLN